jgi:transposase
MAAAYSIDLREKILNAWQGKEGSQRSIAKKFKVSFSFIKDLLHQYKETGTIIPRKQGGDRRSKLKEKEQELLKKIVSKQNDIYLREIKSTLEKETGIEVSTSSLCRTLKKLKLNRKKKA